MSSIEIDVFDPPTLARPAPELAPALIGALLVRLTPELGALPALVGRIVETEAYTERDAASHSFRGPDGRARVMFGPPGNAYVYLIYGMYTCLNVVCGTDGAGQAVLIRAVEPLHGAAQMRTNRLTSRALARKDDAARTRLAERLGRRPEEIANGPGKVGAAFGVTVQRDYGKSLASSDLLLAERVWIGEAGSAHAPANTGPSGDRTDGAQPVPGVLTASRGEVATSPRIGITENTAPHWRFFERDNPAVSKR